MNYILQCVCLLAVLLTCLCAAEPEPYHGEAITSGAIYRADVGRSGVFDKTGVVSLTGEKWKSNIGGKITSSPVAWGGVVYIGSPKGVHAIDAETGAEKWMHATKSAVESSACIANEKIFFATVKGKLLCLSLTGELLWEYTGRAQKELAKSSPAVAYGMVFCALSSEIVGLDMTNGKKIWSIKKNVPLEYSSMLMASDAFYGCGTLGWGYLFSYDYETLTVNWHSRSPYPSGAGMYFFKTPAMDTDGYLYVSATRGVAKFDKKDRVGAAKGQRGRIAYQFLLDKQVDDNELIANSAPTPWKDKVFTGRKDGKFFALSAKDLSVQWKKIYSAEILSDPSVASKSNIVYFGCHDGKLYALHTDTGEEAWSFTTGGPIFSSPWVDDDVVYVASQDGYLYAIH